jgi:hypothetical protein
VIRSFSVAVALLVVAVPAVLAASTAKDPKVLVLRQSDFPAGTRVGNAYGVKGPLSSTYTVGLEIRPGDIEREEDVSVQLWVAKDVAGAKSIYQQTLATYTGKGPQIGSAAKAFKGEVTLKLPSYGDEQFADYLPNPSRPHGQLIVRKNTVVWYLTVENCTPLAFSCYGTSRTEKPIGQTRATAELSKYGAKQKAHVGKG